MILTDQLTARSGPLARVWLASHWERKLSKSQFLHTNLEKTIDAIATNQEHDPIALRISGQLLLGVVRIYSRKTRYLLEDCNEALTKIKLAFKTGDVTMPDIDQAVAKMNTITLPERLTEFDILLPDPPLVLDSVAEELDPILDSLASIPASQDITMSDIQDASFRMGDWEQGRAGSVGLGMFAHDDIEMARREQEPEGSEIVLPMEEMNKMRLDDREPSQDLLDFDFDFDDAPVDDQRSLRAESTEFEIHGGDQALPSSLSTVLQPDIVADASLDPNVFAVDSTAQDTPTRRRRRLVVDKVTELSHDDIKRFIDDTSSIVDRSLAGPLQAAKTKTAPALDLNRPMEAVASDVEQMFVRLNRKRRASENLTDRLQHGIDVEEATNKERRLSNQAELMGDEFFDIGTADMVDSATFSPILGATTELATPAPAATLFDHPEEDFSSQFMTQNTQSVLNRHTRETAARLQTSFATQPTVEFGELALASSTKAEAARLFYDMLVLSSKDLLRVRQDQPYGRIEMTSKATLLAL